MLNGCIGESVLFVPFTRPLVKNGRPLLSGFMQALAQQLGKKMVIAIPVPRLIQRNDEEVGVFQHFQGRLAVVLAGEGVAQGSCQPVEDGSLEQESLNLRGLLV